MDEDVELAIKSLRNQSVLDELLRQDLKIISSNGDITEFDKYFENKRYVKMSRLIRNDEKEVYCTNCNCKIGYYPEDVYTIKNSFNPEVKDIRIKCPNKECGCSIFLGEISE